MTQASLRLAGTFWALDTELAHARHFPAVGWTTSYSLYVDQPGALVSRTHVDDAWPDRRAEAIALLAREKQLLDIVQLVGADALPDDGSRSDLEVARLLRETFLQQHAFDPVDAARPLDVQFALLEAVLAAGTGIRRALERGAVARGGARRARSWRSSGGERWRPWTGRAASTSGRATGAALADTARSPFEPVERRRGR